MNTLAQPRASDYDILSFDCYGTLVDWETAITSTLQSILLSHDAHWNDAVLLEHFALLEPAEQEHGGSYRDVLGRVLKQFGTRLGFVPTESQLIQFEECIARAAPFPDTVDALKTLSESFQLAIISNTDDDLFALTAQNLLVSFDYVITAEQVGLYKPNLAVFEHAVKEFSCSKSRIIHVAQSLFHDVAPANALGIATAWIDRTRGKPGATASSDATPQWTYQTLAELAGTVQDS
ncbi:MAG: HAD-IA family hydrolase [Gammaproteobacteria bacterium]|nr:HAD-IA family hydrolase [Gammaproteobacteria bacterium]MYF02567.1 HAD-IA family hydrolase [Gammaproteobacteria bacterium]